MIHPPTKTDIHTDTHTAGPRAPGVSILTHFIYHAVAPGMTDTHTHTHTINTSLHTTRLSNEDCVPAFSRERENFILYLLLLCIGVCWCRYRQFLMLSPAV